MKFKILRVLVLLISISAASCLVWNASRNEEPKKESVVDPDDMQFSSKSGPMMSPDDVKKLDGKGVYDFIIPVEGDPVKPPKSRDLMSSSKSIDAILTPSDLEGLREGSKAKQRMDLIPSSKNPNRILKREDIEQIIEGRKSDFEKPLEPKLPPLEK